MRLLLLRLGECWLPNHITTAASDATEEVPWAGSYSEGCWHWDYVTPALISTSKMSPLCFASWHQNISFAYAVVQKPNAFRKGRGLPLNSCCHISCYVDLRLSLHRSWNGKAETSLLDLQSLKYTKVLEQSSSGRILQQPASGSLGDFVKM